VPSTWLKNYNDNSAFAPLYQSEALWVKFSSIPGSSVPMTPHRVELFLRIGNKLINAVTGEEVNPQTYLESHFTSIPNQNYLGEISLKPTFQIEIIFFFFIVVCPPESWYSGVPGKTLEHANFSRAKKNFRLLNQIVSTPLESFAEISLEVRVTPAVRKKKFST
jgi:hypothetical protein